MAEKVKKEKKPVGRPNEYNQDKAVILCAYISDGMSLRTACKQKDMPDPSTVFRWMRENEEFYKQYARATEERTEAMAEDIIDISDESLEVIKKGGEKKSGAYAQAQRLRVDTRKWIMAKMKPKKYADSIDVTSDGKAIVGNTIVIKDFNGTAGK